MTIKEIVSICNGKVLSGSDNISVSTFSKDTRTIEKGDLYVGIKGEKFDGNEYTNEAFKLGASAALIDNPNIDINSLNDKTIVLVDNTIDALCELARKKRDNFKGTVIGVTGSVGKTTTKDLIVSLVETKYKVLKTEGSYNNNIGLPLCIINGKEADVWVIEMGMNNFGEISFLSKIVRPHYSVITNIGTSHIGILGSRENILKAKLEILDGMDNHNLIINNDNDLLHNYYLNNKDNVITVGINNDSQYNIRVKDNNCFDINDSTFELFSTEEPLLIDASLSYAVARIMNVPENSIKESFKNFKQLGNRLKEEKAKSGFIVINDAFNANYDSVKLAINYLSKFNKRKIIVLGDMLELGDYALELHKEVGKLISSSNIDILLTVGELSLNIMNSTIENGYFGKCKHFDNNEECLKYIKTIINKNDIILVKASKKMNFVNLCEKIKEL